MRDEGAKVAAPVDHSRHCEASVLGGDPRYERGAEEPGRGNDVERRAPDLRHVVEKRANGVAGTSLVAVIQGQDHDVLEIGDLLDRPDTHLASGHDQDSGAPLAGLGRLARLEQAAAHAESLGVSQREGGVNEVGVGPVRTGLCLDVSGEWFVLAFHDGVPLHLVDSFVQISRAGTADPP